MSVCKLQLCACVLPLVYINTRIASGTYISARSIIFYVYANVYIVCVYIYIYIHTQIRTACNSMTTRVCVVNSL